MAAMAVQARVTKAALQNWLQRISVPQYELYSTTWQTSKLAYQRSTAEFPAETKVSRHYKAQKALINAAPNSGPLPYLSRAILPFFPSDDDLCPSKSHYPRALEHYAPDEAGKTLMKLLFNCP